MPQKEKNMSQPAINHKDTINTTMTNEHAQSVINDVREEMGIKEVIKLFDEDHYWCRDKYAHVKLKDGRTGVLRIVSNNNNTKPEQLAIYKQTNALGDESPYLSVLERTNGELIANDKAILLEDFTDLETAELSRSGYHDFYDVEQNDFQERFNDMMAKEILVLKKAQNANITVPEDQQKEFFRAEGAYNILKSDKFAGLSQARREQFSTIFNKASKLLELATEQFLLKESYALQGNKQPGTTIVPNKRGVFYVGTETVIGHRANDLRHLFLQGNGNRFTDENVDKALALTEKMKDVNLEEAINMASETLNIGKYEIAACGALHAASQLIAQIVSQEAKKLTGNAKIKSDAFIDLAETRFNQLWEIAEKNGPMPTL